MQPGHTSTFSVGGHPISLQIETRRQEVHATIATGEMPPARGFINELQRVVSGFTHQMREDLDCRISSQVNERAIQVQISGVPREAVEKYLAGLPDYVRANWSQTRTAAAGAGSDAAPLAG